VPGCGGIRRILAICGGVLLWGRAVGRGGGTWSAFPRMWGSPGWVPASTSAGRLRACPRVAGGPGRGKPGVGARAAVRTRVPFPSAGVGGRVGGIGWVSAGRVAGCLVMGHGRGQVCCHGVTMWLLFPGRHRVDRLSCGWLLTTVTAPRALEQSSYSGPTALDLPIRGSDTGTDRHGSCGSVCGLDQGSRTAGADARCGRWGPRVPAGCRLHGGVVGFIPGWRGGRRRLRAIRSAGVSRRRW
jgi:hypothetical protein